MSDDARLRRLMLQFWECATQVIVDVHCRDDRWTGQCARLHQLMSGLDPAVDRTARLVAQVATSQGADNARACYELRCALVDMRNLRIAAMAAKNPEVIEPGRNAA